MCFDELVYDMILLVSSDGNCKCDICVYLIWWLLCLDVELMVVIGLIFDKVWVEVYEWLLKLL